MLNTLLSAVGLVGYNSLLFFQHIRHKNELTNPHKTLKKALTQHVRIDNVQLSVRFHA